MIVPMKKVAIIVQSKDVNTALKGLRSLGVVHVENEQLPRGTDIASLKDDIAVIEKVISILSDPAIVGKSGLKSARHVYDWRFAAKHVVDLYNRFYQLEEYLRTMRKAISEWEGWGNFDPAKVTELAKRNIYIRLYQIPAKEIEKLPEGDYVIKKLSVSAGIANCAIISRQKIEVPFKEIIPPRISLGAMKERLAEDNGIMESIRDNIRKYTFYRDRFLRIKRAFENELEFHEAVKGMGQAGAISYLKGYVPRDEADSLVKTATAAKWGIYVSEPAEDDNPPTLIRNPRWVSIISNVFKLIEIVPGYRELDISLCFLVFLSIFFGMLVGDAGVGVIFFIITMIAHKLYAKKIANRSLFTLFYVFSLCSIAWGVLSGTIFGQEWLGPSFRPLVPALRDDKTVQKFCFFLGATHLSIAHTWRFILKLPSVTALADIGWMMILWGAFFLAKLLILGEVFPHFAIWFFIIGPVLAIFFTSPNKNILKGIGSGLGNFLLNFVNNFTDVVSYIRLFAVGLAGVAIANAFNNMAIGIGFKSFGSGLIASIVLIIGHSLNVVLGPLSVLVHGVRLNVLEFCTHLDIKWSGFPYKPLKEDTVNGKTI